MTFDYIVLLVLWIILPIVLYIIVPRHRIREFLAVFLFFQTLTWLFSIGLTYFEFLESPVREFKFATQINFTVEYLVFPTAAVMFQRWFPNGSGKLRRSIHYLLSVGGILFFMFLLGTFTNIMEIKLDNLIRSAFNFTFELWLCRKYIVWLMKQVTLQKEMRVDGA